MNEDKPKVQELEVIKNDVEINITLNSFMYHRLTRLLTTGIAFKDLEEFGQIVDKIKKGESTNDAIAYHTETILILMNALEDAAKAQGKTKMAKISLETGKEVVE